MPDGMPSPLQGSCNSGVLAKTKVGSGDAKCLERHRSDSLVIILCLPARHHLYVDPASILPMF
jgi:hypothetical protein